MADTKEEMGGRSRTDGRATHITRHIDDRKEWCCCLCSETNVWTRSRCRGCQTNIPSVLQDQHMQAVSTKSGRSWSESASVRVNRKCWHMRHSGTERQNCVSCDKKTRDSNMKGGTCPCTADKPVRKSGVKRTKNGSGRKSG